MENTEQPTPQPVRYVTYQPDGSLDGCYLQVPPDEHAGRMIVVDEAQAGAWVKFRATPARDGVELAPPAPASAVDLGALKTELVESVDAHIAAIYGRWLRFEAEYVEREAAARIFVNAGYAGDPGEWVTSFSQHAGKTPTAAADLIITQADMLRAALKSLGALRMAKYGILAAVDVGAAQSVRDEIIAQADQIAAGL